MSVTVTCVDDAPVAVDDSATVAEDSARERDRRAGQRHRHRRRPEDGRVGRRSRRTARWSITGGGDGLTYEPDANYCNSQAGGTPDTFTYTLNGGRRATVSVTVTCVDDQPVAVNDSATVAEDSGATAIDVLANDTDVDGGPKYDRLGVASRRTARWSITGGGTGLTYQPDANYCNARRHDAGHVHVHAERRLAPRRCR